MKANKDIRIKGPTLSQIGPALDLLKLFKITKMGRINQYGRTSHMFCALSLT